MSTISTTFLFISGFSHEKDFKVIFSAVFLLLNSLLLVSLITVYFSKSKKIHVFRDFIYTLLVGLFGFVFNILQIYYFTDDYNYIINNKVNADAGIILGAAVWGGNRPSPVFRERINKGYELYEKKIVPKLVLTGGGYGGELSEAEVAKNELIRYGINENHLIVEKESFSTIEQIFFVRDNLYKRYKWNRIVIISDGFHLFRSRELCRFNDMNTLTVSTDTPLTTESTINFCIKESIAVLFFWFFGIG
ncbi:MAG: YdcF family protein [Ignavibacteria bacterium]|nr:YdcF family protein [Ignavibacteria bacterium]